MMVGSVYADTTGNLIGGTWNNVVTGTHPNNCCTGGPAPLYDPTTNTIHFSYGLTAVHQVVAINQALSGSGIQINGWNWGYDLRNMNGVAGGQGGTDTISVTSFMTNSANYIIQQSDQYFNTQFDWMRFTGSEVLYSPLSLENSGSLGIQFVSSDSGFWAGYYGPQVRNVSLNANYTSVPIDPCTNNPLHSPSCPGYQQAYHDQQCSINPLYAVSCPGYQQAYYNQQCSINPLYDSNCPGYQQAYFNQQCSNNPLYNNQCPGYAQAYFDQQCSLDGLYDRSCPNYNQAYATKQLKDKQNDTSQQIAIPTTSTTEPVVQVKEDGTVSTDVPLVADPTVNQVLTKNTEVKKENTKEEKKDSGTQVEKPKTNTARAAAVAAATKPDPATQTQSEKEFEQTVASQNAAVATLSLVPGFSAYTNALIPDTNALLMRRQYDKPVVDNARAMRQLNGASDRLHQEMINEQYRIR